MNIICQISYKSTQRLKMMLLTATNVWVACHPNICCCKKKSRKAEHTKNRIILIAYRTVSFLRCVKSWLQISSRFLDWIAEKKLQL